MMDSLIQSLPEAIRKHIEGRGLIHLMAQI